MRWGLGLGWLAVALLALVRGRPGGGAWLSCSLGLLLAGCAGLRWHRALLHEVRSVLRDLGLYDARGTVKLGLSALAILMVLVAVWRGGAFLKRQPGGLRVALVAQLGFALFLLLLTGGLDDLLTRALLDPPGRWLLELACLAVAALGVLSVKKDARPRG